jgi:hypothetical protein
MPAARKTRPKKEEDQSRIGPKSSLTRRTRSGRVFKQAIKPFSTTEHDLKLSASVAKVAPENCLNNEVLTCLVSHGLELSSIRALRASSKSLKASATHVVRKIRVGVACARGFEEPANEPLSSALHHAAVAYPMAAKEELKVVFPISSEAFRFFDIHPLRLTATLLNCTLTSNALCSTVQWISKPRLLRSWVSRTSRALT